MEYSAKIEDILLKVEDNPELELNELESVVVEVTEAAALIESDGLHELWHSSMDPDKVIKSFDEIGAFEIVDLIQSSQWCVSAASDRGEFSDTEENHLSEIEEELEMRLEDLDGFLLEYLEA